MQNVSTSFNLKYTCNLSSTGTTAPLHKYSGMLRVASNPSAVVQSIGLSYNEFGLFIINSSSPLSKDSGILLFKQPSKS